MLPRLLLAASTVISTLWCDVVAASSPEQQPPIPVLPLNDAFFVSGKKFWGADVDVKSLNSSTNERLMLVEYGQLSTTHSLNWLVTEPYPEQFIFEQGDYLVKWAVGNNKAIRAGPLLGHTELPSWVSSIRTAEEMMAAIQRHVTTVVSRYRGLVYSWDVIDEPFNDDGTFRETPFYRILGLNYIRIAMRAAREADPDAMLYINDYGMDAVNAKTRSMTRLVLGLNSERFSRVDGIGSKTFLRARSAETIPNALKALSEAKVELALTGLYIQGASGTDYATVVRACLAIPNCVSITNDQPSDYPSPVISPVIYDGTLFNISGLPKQAYWAVLDLLFPNPIPIPTQT